MHGRDDFAPTSDGYPIGIRIGMPIFVDQQDIDAADAQRATRTFDPETDCPIAKALRRRYPLATDVYVNVNRIEVTIHGVTVAYEVTDEMLNFMRAWDRYKGVSPQGFTTRRIVAAA